MWEWVEDCWHPSYDGAPRDGSAWTRGGDCGRSVFRSGSFMGSTGVLSPGNRAWYPADIRDFAIGFRVARTFY